MGIKINATYSCDKCHRAPSDGLDGKLYGWLRLDPVHLTTVVIGHSGVPSESLVLCPKCWPLMLAWTPPDEADEAEVQKALGALI